MKLYTCSHCQNLIYFENDVCLQCRYSLGFDARTLSMITLEKETDNFFVPVQRTGERFRYCKNLEYGVCNWVITEHEKSEYCIACDLNRTIPSLDKDVNKQRWKNIEVAKHRLIYSLLRLKLPVQKKTGTEDTGIAFDFLANISLKEKVITGHDKGVITLNIDEADEAQRLLNKLNLGERYRTLLGHFRHEIGHYYWDLLIQNTQELWPYRKLFGDEEQDYAKALENYYERGAPADWMEHFISPYASSHAWEDWAETWAHYLHLMDTLETAFSFGIQIHPGNARDVKGVDAAIKRDPYDTQNFDQIFEWWLPLTFAVNSLNRSMGHSDFYPFVISDEVATKLKFIHDLIRKGQRQQSTINN